MPVGAPGDRRYEFRFPGAGPVGPGEGGSQSSGGFPVTRVPGCARANRKATASAIAMP